MCFDLSLVEAESSREILIKNSYLASGIVSNQSIIFLFLIWIIKFNKEIEIWFPFIVINNCDLNFLFSLSFRHGDDVVEVGEVLWRYGSVGNSSHTDGQLLRGLLYDGDFDVSVALGDRIVQAFEANDLIFNLDLSLGNTVVNLSLCTLQFNKLFGTAHASLFSIGKSFQERIWLQNSQKSLNFNFCWIFLQNAFEKISDFLLRRLWNLADFF